MKGQLNLFDIIFFSLNVKVNLTMKTVKSASHCWALHLSENLRIFVNRDSESHIFYFLLVKLIVVSLVSKKKTCNFSVKLKVILPCTENNLTKACPRLCIKTMGLGLCNIWREGCNEVNNCNCKFQQGQNTISLGSHIRMITVSITCFTSFLWPINRPTNEMSNLPFESHVSPCLIYTRQIMQTVLKLHICKCKLSWLCDYYIQSLSERRKLIACDVSPYLT